MSQHVPRRDVLLATSQARQAEADVLVSLGGVSPVDGHEGRSIVPHGQTSCIMLPHAMDFNLLIFQEKTVLPTRDKNRAFDCWVSS
jgi:alcohol dehydrogenase class IV